MGAGASRTGRAKGALWKVIIAVALALSPTSAYASSEVPTDQSTQTDLAYELRDDYIEQAIDKDIVTPAVSNPLLDALARFVGMDVSTFNNSGHTLYLKSTLFDQTNAHGDQTFDAIYAREDWMGVIAGQYDSTADLLDPGDDCSYYVAVASTSVQNELEAPTDHVFTTMTNGGEVLEGGIYDYATGLAYLPKSLYRRDGIDAPFACQLQLLIPHNFAHPQTCKTDVSIQCHDGRVKPAPGQTIESSACDVTLKMPVADAETAAYLSLEDIHLFLNGSDEAFELIEGQTAAWDSTTGTLEINVSPQTVLRADITIDAPTLLEFFTEPANALSTSDLAYVPSVAFDRLNLDTLTVGRTIPFESEINYWWPNPKPDDVQWQACIKTGPYCYSWINDPAGLYEYLAWSEGANWGGVSSQEVSNFIFDPNAGQAARHYFNYVFLFGNRTLEDQSFHSVAWPINQPYNIGYGQSSFGLQCSHTSNAIGTPVGSDCKGRMMLRILDVNLEAERPYVVIGFVGPSVANQPGVGIYKFEIELAGEIEIQKRSSSPELSDGNPNYQFAGISYDIFADQACTSHVGSITLDENGYGKSQRLKKGTYYLRENAASTLGKGFVPSTALTPVSVATREAVHLDLTDSPQSYQADVLLEKIDAVGGSATPQGDGSLEGAVFEVKYYKALFSDANSAASFQPARTWRFATDADGRIRLDEAHQVGGDALFRTQAGSICLPLGSLTIKEAAAPTGYRLESTVHVIPLKASGSAETLRFSAKKTIPEQIMRGGVLIEKLDKESGLADPLGAASLDGTTFEIRNASSQAVCVDGIMHASGSVVRRIVAEGGSASTEPDALPFGTYEIQEVAAGTGYLASDTTVRTFKIERDGYLVCLKGDKACTDQVKRGDIDLCKIREDDQSRLARIPFILESQTTGERHVVVTDENGLINTSAAWHAHATATNANDWALDLQEDGEASIPSSELDPHAGIWFGQTANGSITPPDDGLGALPYDTYTLTELRAEANEGLDLVAIKGISVTAHNVCVPLGTIHDRITPPLAITTSARSAQDGSKSIHPNRNARVIDRIDYCNLTPGTEYLLSGSLMDAESGEAVTDSAQVPVTTELTFTPVTASGSCEVAFEFDALTYAGRRLVCLEKLRAASTGETVAAHEDLADQGQSVEVLEPLINTYATDGATHTKQVDTTGTVSIVDAVSYSGLEAGAEYTLHGQLMRKLDKDGTTVAEPVVDEEGNELVCAMDFTPSAATGSTAVTFELNADKLPDGAELVVFETLSRDGRDLVVHQSPDNAAQTVELLVPQIGTHAFEKESGESHVQTRDNLVITDEVAYEGINPTKEYTLFGTVMRAAEESDGTISVTPLLDEAGNEVSVSVRFTPEGSSGSVQLDFNIDASALGDTRLVIFERLMGEGGIVAVHEDAADERQTIWVDADKDRTTLEKIVKQPRVLSTLPQTGDDVTLMPILLVMSAVALMTAAIALSAVRKRQKRQSRCLALIDRGRS